MCIMLIENTLNASIVAGNRNVGTHDENVNIAGAGCSSSAAEGKSYAKHGESMVFQVS